MKKYNGFCWFFCSCVLFLNFACGENKTEMMVENPSKLSVLMTEQYTIQFKQKNVGNKEVYFFEVCLNSEPFRSSKKSCVNAFRRKDKELTFEHVLYDGFDEHFRSTVKYYGDDDFYLEAVPVIASLVMASPIHFLSQFVDLGAKLNGPSAGVVKKSLLGVILATGAVTYFATKSYYINKQKKDLSQAQIDLTLSPNKPKIRVSLDQSSSLRSSVFQLSAISQRSLVKTYDEMSVILSSLGAFLKAWGVVTEDELQYYCLPVIDAYAAIVSSQCDAIGSSQLSEWLDAQPQ
ncbi:MAG: hypothetical protein OXC44_02640 [Proteobacteria bacterium]|nr:hypothetical protein [Pseudomonadota bacterium]